MYPISTTKIRLTIDLSDFLPGALITAPFAFVAGAIVTIVKKYRVVNITGWAITIIGFGLFSTVREDSSVGKWVGYQVVTAIGTGMLVCSSDFRQLSFFTHLVF
jgi:hypothetical protein